jgi:hypothetical protein
MKRYYTLFLLLIIVLPLNAQYKLHSSVFGGGGTSTGGNYIVRGSVYQPNVGNSEAGSYIAKSGFWTVYLLKAANGSVLPVELTSFTARFDKLNDRQNCVTLNWQTATEQNNFGFEVQRSVVSDQRTANTTADSWTLNAESWTKIGFVEGNGNSNSPKEYSFTDNTIKSGKYLYRLKQIDNDGLYSYSNEVEVELENIPTEFALYQNYPNPFNPSTTIKFGLPMDSKVVLEVYNIVGQKVKTLINNESKATGYHQVNFNANELATGIYIYRIKANDYTSTKKFVLMK